MMQRVWLIGGMVLGMVGLAQAGLSGGPYTIEPLDLNGGGTTSTGGVYSLSASTGQSGGVGLISGGVYSASNGFWPGTIGDSPVTSPSGPINHAVVKDSTCPQAANEIEVAASDADSQGASLTWAVKTQPAMGTVSFVDGVNTGTDVAVCYEPAANNTGSYSFVLVVYDGSGGSDEITVNVNVALAPTINAWYSSYIHTGMGEHLLALDPTKHGTFGAPPSGDEPVVEGRRYGVQHLIVDFSGPVVAADNSLDVNDVAVDVDDGGGPVPVVPASVSLTNGGARLNVYFTSSGPNYLGDQVMATFDLTGKFKAPSGQLVTGDTDCAVGCLAGNVASGHNQVGLNDVAAIKANNRTPVGPTTYKFDLNGDGRINLIDAAMARSYYLRSLP